MTRYPPGVPCWVDVATSDLDASSAFYAGLFDWAVEQETPDDPYRIARLGGREVAGLRELAGAPPGWTTYVRVEDAGAGAARVSAAGGQVMLGPFDVVGGRVVACADPAGAAFCLWEPGGREGAELVNASGSWNWSDLETPDQEGAAAFYGAVAGWEAVPMGDVAMWRLPGYGDFLAARDPDLRRRHGKAGVPPGFSDAVGWLAHGDEARWSVTFAVDDADAVAARAAELGGTVVTPPFDAGPARVALLADPDGAGFSVSRYAP